MVVYSTFLELLIRMIFEIFFFLNLYEKFRSDTLLYKAIELILFTLPLILVELVVYLCTNKNLLLSLNNQRNEDQREVNQNEVNVQLLLV